MASDEESILARVLNVNLRERYATCSSLEKTDELSGTITFTLSSDVWHSDELPVVQTDVVLSMLEFREGRGWRAQRAHPPLSVGRCVRCERGSARGGTRRGGPTRRGDFGGP